MKDEWGGRLQFGNVSLHFEIFLLQLENEIVEAVGQLEFFLRERVCRKA